MDATIPDPDAVEAMPGHLLRRCQQIAVAIFLDQCRDADLTPLQFVTLATLDRLGEMDKATLGGEIALDRTTIAVVAANLEGRGLVVSRDSETDRRARLIEITPGGRSALIAVRPDVRKAQERILGPLEPAEQAELVRLLAKMASANNLLSRAPQRRKRRSAG